MEYALLLLLLVMAIGANYIHRLKSAASAPAASDVSTVTPPPDDLTLRLHAFNQIVEPFASNAAHMNEIRGNNEFEAAVRLLASSETQLTTVRDYAFGQAWLLSCAAFVALTLRADGETISNDVPARLDGMSIWQIKFALGYLARLSTPLPAGAPLLGYSEWWSDSALLRHAFHDYFDALGADDEGLPGADVIDLPVGTRQTIVRFLKGVRHPLGNRIAEAIGGDGLVDDAPATFLSSLGKFWDTGADANLLVEPDVWKDGLAGLDSLIERQPARVLLISGETQVGKSTFLRLLAKRAAVKGWRVFDASGADLQAGQIYIGQLEARIRETLQELDVRKKLIWYVPDFLALAMSGTHSSQSASILDQMMPALAAGRVQIWTEATPSQTARLLNLRPALRRTLEILRLDPMDDDETLMLAKELGDRLARNSNGVADPDFSRTAVEAARHYLSSSNLPGSALALMKTTALRIDKMPGKRMTGHDLLETLAQHTGLPLSILDGAERLSLEAVREFFAGRVIGQPEAVDSIVERIAMLKSGLNDPGKPIGVFLFAGPTGTGKTELAKTAAEYLFGSVERMIRLDMSEFQTHDALAKIIGGASLPADAETLIARIRKQPFSLVLLDEFEKAHPQIWDLFLQVFDDGRLSDATGQTADFRHCLIILTTNLGATVHQDSGIGFTRSASGFTNDQVLRSVGQTFRPEFQNRLDRIIVFKPLTRELMRKILDKELSRIFERRGLKDRDWAVEWDASALEFLLEKGFTTDMGARPLKRAIDHYVVAPLAATIVERRFPEGDQFVFVRRDGTALRAEFVDPDADADGSFAGAAPLDVATGDLPTLAG